MLPERSSYGNPARKNPSEGDTHPREIARVRCMSYNNEEQLDPAGSTQKFQRFVAENREEETEPRRPILPYVFVGLSVILAIGIILTVVLTWS